MSTVEPVPAHFTDPETNKKLTRRVLWKLDTRILPALALVRVLSPNGAPVAPAYALP